MLFGANAVPLRNFGVMYFIPRDHAAQGRKILLIVHEVRVRTDNARTRRARASMAVKVPLVDREVLAESLELLVNKEPESLIKQMSPLLKAEKNVSEGRSRGFVEPVRKLKENVAEYEESLQINAGHGGPRRPRRRRREGGQGAPRAHAAPTTAVPTVPPPTSIRKEVSTMKARSQASYLGADRNGTEFWLSGPHVFSAAADGTRTRHVCALARFNRRAQSRQRGTTGKVPR